MSPLFSTQELARPASERGPMRPTALSLLLPPALYLLSKGRQALRQHVGRLEPDKLTHYATGGRWSAHELLQFILEHTGPARVSISTWTITEAPVRALLALREAGLITELDLLFDHRIKTRCPKAVQLVAALGARVHLAKCHAKVTVVENDEWAVTVLTSQNYTRNPRIEAGVIFTDRASADFHRSWMAAQIQGNQPFI
ncbi:MAG: hypothetical protein ACRYFX_04545 [Janthinobacterium lividum]